jgi:hypothetical protein
MSFRLFIYYGTAWSAAAGYTAWALGRLIEGDAKLLAALQGMSLGLLTSLCLAILDARCTDSAQGVASVGARLVLAMLIGALGGLAGGFLAELLHELSGIRWTMLCGWTLTGLLIGLATASSDFMGAVFGGGDRRRARRKLRNGLIGGILGGILGGAAWVLLYDVWANVFPDADVQELWSAGASGFVALAGCIGLMVALTLVSLGGAGPAVKAT